MKNGTCYALIQVRHSGVTAKKLVALFVIWIPPPSACNSCLWREFFFAFFSADKSRYWD